MAEKKKEYPTIEETAFRMNGTFLKDGDAGAALISIAESLKRIADGIERFTGTTDKPFGVAAQMNSNLGRLVQHAELTTKQRAEVLARKAQQP